MDSPSSLTIRLNRYLSQCGLGSRRECDRLIAAGSIQVNGNDRALLGTRIDPIRDIITCRGNRVGKVLPLQYIAYYKTRGILVTAQDPENRPTIYDALDQTGFNARHLKYAGRLDRNSEGLLLLTNDGRLLHALTHPRFGIKKTYQVRIDRLLLPEHIDTMISEGVKSEGQVLRAGKISRCQPDDKAEGHWYEIDLFEGKNRHIRRMLESLEYEVFRVRRIQFGCVTLQGLEPGSWRELGVREVKGLIRLGYPVHDE